MDEDKFNEWQLDNWSKLLDDFIDSSAMRQQEFDDFCKRSYEQGDYYE